jgi:hypothetical protein
MKMLVNARRAVWTIPALLGLLTVIGLTSALLGDGLWDVVSWCALGLPLVASAWMPALESARNPSDQ